MHGTRSRQEIRKEHSRRWRLFPPPKLNLPKNMSDILIVLLNSPVTVTPHPQFWNSPSFKVPSPRQLTFKQTSWNYLFHQQNLVFSLLSYSIWRRRQSVLQNRIRS